MSPAAASDMEPVPVRTRLEAVTVVLGGMVELGGLKLVLSVGHAVATCCRKAAASDRVVDTPVGAPAGPVKVNWPG